ncbi:MAG: hypothetical protein ACLP07_15160 [Terracidiphilus sp.]
MTLMTRSVLCVVIVLIALQDLRASEKKKDSVASAHNHILSISIVNDPEKFVAGNNAFCVVFTKSSSAEPASVTNVKIEFAQQVGKIRERPVRAQVTESDLGHFCGNVDLGKQYYDPAFYYVYLRYTDASGRRRKCNLSFSVKHE